MNYIIYELIKPEHLQKKELDGYNYKDVTRFVWEELDERDVEAKHKTIEGATAEIANHAEQLKGRDLAIIPVVSVSWDGNIY